MTTYAITFFTNRRKPTQATADAAADKAKRGGLVPVNDHFCGVSECAAVNGGCAIRRRFNVACACSGTYTWPKN